MTNQPAYLHNGQPISREGFYAIACDPQRSVAVQACAGAGKTWMLVSRILRALLEGARAKPQVLAQDILAITFTKKAAGEMRARLNEWLAQFANKSLTELEAELRVRGFVEQNLGFDMAEDTLVLQNLYRNLLQSGRSVQIRTFHSWFASLLRHAPMALLQQMGLPAQYELLEQDGDAIALVWPRFFQSVAKTPDALADFETSVRLYGRSQTLKALAVALNKRVEFCLADQHQTLQDSVRHFGELFPGYAHLERPEDALSGDLAHQRWHAWSKALAQEKNKTPQKAAEAVVDAFLTPDLMQRLALLRKAFFVAAEDRLTAHLTKFDAAKQAEVELQSLCGAAAQFEARQHHQRMVRLTRIAIDEYRQLKRERGWIDMNDVEQAAQAMLNSDELSGWLQQRLDAHTRHLLIDEFQDTSPLQWQTLYHWLSGYAGAGGGMTAPKVFIVGDPKQSIYRFRRAEPQVFKAALGFVVNGLGGDELTCDHTHRNAPEVVSAVNAVMQQAQDNGEFEGFHAHTTESVKPGALLALPAIERDAPPGAQDGAQESVAGWRNSLSTPRELPEVTLRTRECRQAARWIAQQITPDTQLSDIMVLARKRVSLSAMQDALRELHIPANQPEKTNLGAAPEVGDIIALLDAMLSPSHDLSLAQALKSPVFGCTDEDLTQLARLQRQSPDRHSSWWDLLQHPEQLPTVLQAAGVQLTAWQLLLQSLPPHDALQTMFDQGDWMARFLAAAPAASRTRVQANLQALLGAALNHQGGRFVTPYALVRALKAGKVIAPASASPGAVQLLTVHGAKGLEAQTVLLLDTDGTAARADTMAALIEWPGEEAAPTRFSFLLKEKAPPICNRQALLNEQAARQREELNALYVAMTRAKQRLVLSSVVPARPQANSWWARLQPLAASVSLPQAILAATPRLDAPIQVLELPLWHIDKAKLAKKREAIASQYPQQAARAASARLGEAMHRLLEWPPLAGQGHWSHAQLNGVAREFTLDATGLEQAHAMAQRIRGGDAAWVWDDHALSWCGDEVPISWRGKSLRLDRLVQRADDRSWWVLDYKSAAEPERQPELRLQLLCYRLAVQQAYPEQVVHAAFLTSQGQLWRLPDDEPNPEDAA
jgi:ATP-dependent helicase/nuclease subunit A